LLLSVVVPCYNEQEAIEHTYKEIKGVLRTLKDLDHEIIFVDDGSADDTLPRLNALAESVERSSQRVGRLALQLDREPQSAIFGRKPGRPGPGEPGFQ